MYIPASLIVAAIIVIALSAIALLAYANHRGYNAGSNEYQELIRAKNGRIDELNNTIAHNRAVRQREREYAAEAMEELEAQHQKERGQLYRELGATVLSAAEVRLIADAAGKLRLASPALHAQQQFAAARQTKELAARLDILIKRLQPSDEAEERAA